MDPLSLGTLVKLYFACVETWQAAAVRTNKHKNILISFFYYRKKNLRDYFLKNQNKFHNFFMDSGAFSFNSLGVEIDIDEYIECIKEDQIEHYSVLDVIGDPKATQENYLYMKSKDLNPVPCFHINTDINYLDFYLEECDKLAIGGMVKARNIDINLKKIWFKILSKNKKIDVHGFGVSGISLALNYPWNSIDSSSYVSICRHARASEWIDNKFNDISTFDLLDELRISTEKLDTKKSIGGIDGLLAAWQISQYNQMIDYVNEKQKEKTWDHLTAQMSMF